MSKFWAKLRTLIQRVIVTQSGDATSVPSVQVTGLGGKAHDAEVFLPQGLYVRAPAGAEGIEVAPAGVRAAAALLAASDRSTWPAGGEIADGEGGLHYLGAWKLFMAADGTVHLGVKAGATEIPRDDKIQKELVRLKGELNDVKSDLQAIQNVFTAWVVAATDGGAALKTAWEAGAGSVPSVNPSDPGETKSTYGRIT